MATFEELNRKLETPNKVDFGDTISQSIDLFKKILSNLVKGITIVLTIASLTVIY